MNILVFTSIYPIIGTKTGVTPVVKYFCEDWVRMGHRVVVISSTTKFPALYYSLPEILNKKIENIIGFNVPNKFGRLKIRKTENGVELFQLPNFKISPGKIITKRQIDKNLIEIYDYLNSINFKPDLAVGHWVNPQIQYLSSFKNKFNIPTSLVIHEIPNVKECELLKDHISDIDNLGFRCNKLILPTLSAINDSPVNKFMCYSGVNDFYNISSDLYEVKKINFDKIKVIFVGNLISRKYPEIIIKALNKLPSTIFEIHYVGDGDMINKIKKIETNNNISVFLHGRLRREKVYDLLKDANFLVMLSKNETFGLVYLEAMLNRVIPIASYMEGFDGIIKNDVNGFLGNAGSVEDLKQIFENILNKSEDDIYRIQRNAYNTAINMSDQKMAKEYLSNIIKKKYTIK